MARPKKHKPRDEVLLQALKDVANREETYGDPNINHEAVARLHNAWMGIRSSDDTPFETLPFDSCVFQILTNLARLSHSPDHKGSWDNIAGYAGIGYEVTK